MKISFYFAQEAYQVNFTHFRKYTPLWWACTFDYQNSGKNIRFGCDYLTGEPRFQTDLMGYGYLLKHEFRK